MMKRSALCLAVMAALTIFAPASAQETQSTERPFADIPDSYFREADRVMEHCTTHANVNQYYNCECLSMGYLDARIKKPAATSDSLMRSITQQCVDTTGAAGNSYENCMTSLPLMPMNAKPEEYCKCFANTYSKLFKQLKVDIDSRTMIDLQTRSYVSCSNPELGRQLYSVNP